MDKPFHRMPRTCKTCPTAKLCPIQYVGCVGCWNVFGWFLEAIEKMKIYEKKYLSTTQKKLAPNKK